MHIFLVNDDGIGAKGVMALLRSACARGHRVTMCAPRDQQSAMSHRFTLTEPIYVSDYPVEEQNAVAFSIAGSPVDCVRIGLQELAREPVDILISGVNNGYNAGMAVHYSGTVGAAMEGVLHHLPAIAVSIHHDADEEMLAHLANLTVETAERYAVCGAPPHMLLNINAPCVKPGQLKPVAYAPLSTANFKDGYERRVSPRAGVYYWLMDGCRTEEPAPGTDQDLLSKGHVVFTMMGNPACLPQAGWERLGL